MFNLRKAKFNYLPPKSVRPVGSPHSDYLIYFLLLPTMANIIISSPVMWSCLLQRYLEI